MYENENSTDIKKYVLKICFNILQFGLNIWICGIHFHISDAFTVSMKGGKKIKKVYDCVWLRECDLHSVKGI